ncbi:SusD/RagB family nutrient-binding outer membrane lipoprotein [Dyadobacter sp. CY261]|uniref:SusD/RagB family nutrient-binding outer membrane lipoprotein n=1 Tax=Dyadobacter sp. CY261 TaxID=2907203 RepID=UPI001F15751D|nr:SusD/RagB family nutrient-binding outer membrane lipoprotein [Dyadobacter sp. CY261]MCF0070424.1 SusD/RagB family nutrient-binding outer membrane lipoprotein [Dyadobacter sp. CY261]
MNRILKHCVWALMLLASFSCDSYLDINENPNAATSASALLVLPQAITGSAALSNAYNSYGAHFGGFMANAGGFSGFGNLFNYQLVPGDHNTLWISTYDNLQDFQYVIEQTTGNDELAYANAAAKIMTALTYQRLVDAFNDVPYSEALKSNANLTPKYDNAAVIYQDLIDKLDEAIGVINNAKFPKNLSASSDPLFSGNMNKWKQFANTLKLRMLIRVSGVATLSDFAQKGIKNIDTTIGFLTDDAIINPGYVKDKPNPLWNSWAYSPTGTLSNSSRTATKFAFGFYKGQKLTDNGRGSVIYKNFETNTPVNQLGNEVDAPTVVTNYSTWYTGTFSSASSISSSLGVMKGPSQGQPLLLAAEAHFLQAEAKLKGYLTGEFADSFQDGIIASFRFLYKDVTNVVSTTKDVNADAAAYKKDNPDSYLVNLSLAKTSAEKLEAIITQKYIALNMINSDEAWNEFRRTGYPVTNPNGDAYHNIASLLSNSTRPDKMPSRILYPSSEQSYNTANYKALNQFSDLIFWDAN